MSLRTRVIACLDVKHGRVVKGVNFINLTDEGDCWTWSNARLGTFSCP